MFDKTVNNYESKVVVITKEIEKTISPGVAHARANWNEYLKEIIN